MINEIVWNRMLYVGIGLITAVAAILAILVIPPSTIPERLVTLTWVIVIVHLLIIVALLWIINVIKHGGQKKELLVIAGWVLIVVSLYMLDGAFASLGKPDKHGLSFWMFICVGCDFVAGLLAIIARDFLKRKSLSK
jgi:hypothetical protein